MKSKVQFQLTGVENSNSLTPVIRLEVSRSEDARDFIAKAFTQGFGYNHNLLQWERIDTDVTIREPYGPASFDSTYDIKPFHPDKKLVVLDVSSLGDLPEVPGGISPKNNFRGRLVELCQDFRVIIDINACDGLNLSDTDVMCSYSGITCVQKDQ